MRTRSMSPSNSATWLSSLAAVSWPMSRRSILVVTAPPFTSCSRGKSERREHTPESARPPNPQVDRVDGRDVRRPGRARRRCGQRRPNDAGGDQPGEGGQRGCVEADLAIPTPDRPAGGLLGQRFEVGSVRPNGLRRADQRGSEAPVQPALEEGEDVEPNDVAEEPPVSVGGVLARAEPEGPVERHDLAPSDVEERPDRRKA